MQVIIPQRIRPEPGDEAMHLRGDLRSHQTQYYVLRGREGQVLRVRVASDHPVQLIIYGEDGTVLKSGMGEEPRFTGRLPSSQNYVIALRAGDRSTDFHLRVRVMKDGVDLLED
jgi:hypothetical protein